MRAPHHTNECPICRAVYPERTNRLAIGGHAHTIVPRQNVCTLAPFNDDPPVIEISLYQWPSLWARFWFRVFFGWKFRPVKEGK